MKYQNSINADADLLELFEIKDYKSEITAKITNATIRALGRDTKSIDGFRPYLGIVDEYHAHKVTKCTSVKRRLH